MKQILQNLRTGQTELTQVTVPRSKTGHLFIQTTTSLISAGTERMLIDFGKAGWIDKARQQPEKVQQALDKIRTDGLMPTLDAVRSKLDQPLPLGYCNVGKIAEGSQNGKRMISNGPHAEYVCVPENLCAEIPDSVSDEEAAFTVVGAIGLQGVRLAQPTLGESFVVTGLGLIGLLTVQILLANGCRVLGIDFDSAKCDLARQFGADIVDLSKDENPIDSATVFSNDRGVDGVLITAATKSNEPVHQAAQMCRKRGRIVLTGVTGLELNRSDFYEKELSFQVSCSYGPGRYDPEYEEKGHDYPIGFVRWTEQRNFEAILDLMASGKLNTEPLISHRFPLEKAQDAYDLILENREPYLGIILTYDESGKKTASVSLGEPTAIQKLKPKIPVAGVIGAGNFTGQVILPALQKTKIRLKTIASGGGVSGTHLGKKFGFGESTTDAEKILSDPEINTVFITTRHNTHARFVLKALEAGKHVFIEKPLCLTLQELEEIAAHCLLPLASHSLSLMVGFNRRFAPHIVKIKEMLDSVREPKSFIMTVNAGKIPLDHWTQDPEVGGGRIVGEACHFIDLLRFLSGTGIINSNLMKLNSGIGDTVSIQLGFEDGSIGSIHYFANGNKAFPKERLEVFAAQKILQLDNFKTLKGHGWQDFKKMRLWRQDKGHEAEIKAFAEAVENGSPSPIPFEEIREVMRTTLELTQESNPY